MNFLDMRTILAGYVLTTAICAAVMASLWQQNRRRSPELIFWFADFLMKFLGLLLILLRGSVPDLVSMVISNTLIVNGTLLLLIGLQRHVGKVGRQWFNYAYLTAFVLVHTYFTLVAPSLQVRTINTAVGLFVLCSQCAWLLLRRADRQSGPKTRAVGVVFVLFCATSIAHISLALLTPIGRSFFTEARYETPVILTYQILYIGLTFALFLMVNRQLVSELEDDIRVRKLTEEALRISEEKFSKAFRSAPYAITLTRLTDGRIVDVNDAFTSMTGWQRAEAEGQTTPGLRLWGTQEGRDRIVAELTKSSRVAACEEEFRKKNGDMLTGQFAAEVIVIDGAQHVLSTISDVTERKRTQEALRASEAQLSNAMEIARLGHWEYDVVDDVFTFNDQFYAIFGTTADKVGGYKMSSAEYARRFVHPDDMAMVGIETRKAIETTDPNFSRQLEHRIIHADGSIGYISVRFFVVKDNRGRTVKTFGANQDITERKQTETVISQKNAQLVELNDMKSQLLGMAAHDLRNPLSIVSTASAFLLDDMSRNLPEAKRTEFIRRINSSSEFMLKLIDNLLDVAKIEAGRLDLELKEEDLCDLIEENLVLNRMLADEKSIRLDFTPECGLPLLRFDRGKIEQVLNNLFSNALKFSAPGTAVSIQVSRVNGSVVVSIRDRGQGIPAEELDRLFKPFGKTSVRSTGDEKSTGLGLAICHKIVEGHGGRIWAESEVGKGTTFFFSLPTAEGQIAPSEIGAGKPLLPEP